MIRSILMLEDDEDDRYITEAAFKEKRSSLKLHFVNSSDDLFAFLFSCERNFLSYPALILLNHYARRANAVDILRELKTNAHYAHIPVIVLSGTASEEIVRNCYAAGACSFIKKPASHNETDDKVSTFLHYWFESVELP